MYCMQQLADDIAVTFAMLRLHARHPVIVTADVVLMIFRFTHTTACEVRIPLMSLSSG